jgi:hypothetical protein
MGRNVAGSSFLVVVGPVATLTDAMPESARFASVVEDLET